MAVLPSLVEKTPDGRGEGARPLEVSCMTCPGDDLEPRAWQSFRHVDGEPAKLLVVLSGDEQDGCYDRP